MYACACIRAERIYRCICAMYKYYKSTSERVGLTACGAFRAQRGFLVLLSSSPRRGSSTLGGCSEPSSSPGRRRSLFVLAWHLRVYPLLSNRAQLCKVGLLLCPKCKRRSETLCKKGLCAKRAFDHPWREKNRRTAKNPSSFGR
jgi:hypothetical protein